MIQELIKKYEEKEYLYAEIVANTYSAEIADRYEEHYRLVEEIVKDLKDLKKALEPR